MNNNVIISCPVTGSGDTAKKHPNLPITPKQIAEAAIEAAKAGAAIAHIHVREPNGSPSRKLEYYKEVADRIRSTDTDVVINQRGGPVRVLRNDARESNSLILYLEGNRKNPKGLGAAIHVLMKENTRIL